MRSILSTCPGDSRRRSPSSYTSLRPLWRKPTIIVNCNLSPLRLQCLKRPLVSAWISSQRMTIAALSARPADLAGRWPWRRLKRHVFASEQLCNNARFCAATPGEWKM